MLSAGGCCKLQSTGWLCNVLHLHTKLEEHATKGSPAQRKHTTMSKLKEWYMPKYVFILAVSISSICID